MNSWKHILPTDILDVQPGKIINNCEHLSGYVRLVESGQLSWNRSRLVVGGPPCLQGCSQENCTDSPAGFIEKLHLWTNCWPTRKVQMQQNQSCIMGENGGTLGMVPSIINSIFPMIEYPAVQEPACKIQKSLGHSFCVPGRPFNSVVVCGTTIHASIHILTWEFQKIKTTIPSSHQIAQCPGWACVLYVPFSSMLDAAETKQNSNSKKSRYIKNIIIGWIYIRIPYTNLRIHDHYRYAWWHKLMTPLRLVSVGIHLALRRAFRSIQRLIFCLVFCSQPIIVTKKSWQSKAITVKQQPFPGSLCLLSFYPCQKSSDF